MTLTREDAFKLAELPKRMRRSKTCGDHLDFAGKLRSAAMKLRAYAQDDTDVEKVARYVRKHCGA